MGASAKDKVRYRAPGEKGTMMVKEVDATPLGGGKGKVYGGKNLKTKGKSAGSGLFPWRVLFAYILQAPMFLVPTTVLVYLMFLRSEEEYNKLENQGMADFSINIFNGDVDQALHEKRPVVRCTVSDVIGAKYAYPICAWSIIVGSW